MPKNQPKLFFNRFFALASHGWHGESIVCAKSPPCSLGSQLRHSWIAVVPKLLSGPTGLFLIR
jgi:hypothetical protein